MELLYFLGILLIGKLLHRNLRTKIGRLTAEVAELRMEVAALQRANAQATAERQHLQEAEQWSVSGAESTLSPAELVTGESMAAALAEPDAGAVVNSELAVPALTPPPLPPSALTPPSLPATLSPVETPAKRWRDSEFWQQLEAQFAGNVTGIVGTLAVVLGVIFLGVYAAIQLNPLGRFGVVCGFAAALYGLSVFLNTRTFWKNLALWLRSASGVTFLMGCLGAVGFETMRWVTDPWLGLGLLCLGLAVNLAFGFLNGGEVFAAIHVIFSLLALSLVPLSGTTWNIAAIVACSGIVMSCKDRHWDRHLLATVLGFTLLHVYWLYSAVTPGTVFPISAVHAMLLCLAVGAVGLLNHYRKTYQSPAMQATPLLAHIMTWATLGVNLYMHSRGSTWSTVFLALAAGVALAMSEWARRLAIAWLYACDRLVALFVALLATVSLHKFGVSAYAIAILAAMVTTLFVRMVAQPSEKIVFRVSNVILLLLYGVVTLQTLVWSVLSEPLETSSYLLLLGSFVLLAVIFPDLQKRLAEAQVAFSLRSQPCTFLEIPLALHGFLAFVLLLKGASNAWLLLLPLAMIFYTVVLRERLHNLLLDVAVLMGTALSLMLCTWSILEASNPLQADVILCLGFLVVGALGWKCCWSEALQQHVTWPGVGVIWLVVTVAIYTFTKGLSPILPGMAWLVVSLLASELQGYKPLIADPMTPHNRTDLFVGLGGLLSLALCIVRYFLVDMANQALVFGSVRIRLLSEVLSLGTIMYWMTFAQQARHSILYIITSYLLEVLLALSAFYVLYEVPSYQHPVVWAIGSFVSYFLGKKLQTYNRLILYSYWLYFGSLFHIAFLSTTIATPSTLFLDQAWVMGLFAAGVSTAFMVVVHRDRASWMTTELTLPPAVRMLAGWQRFIAKFEVKILLYPLFAAIGCFLFWSFDKTILSLLWVVECFVLFLISILMREPQFRIVSMVGIGLVFLRMIFYDLTGRDFFIKAVVFISVGAILIAMNTIYNKYKYRYASQESL